MDDELLRRIAFKFNVPQLPKTLREIKIGFEPFLFFRYVLEDRRPELSEEEAETELGYKYKHQIDFVLCGNRHSFIIRSLKVGYYNHED